MDFLPHFIEDTYYCQRGFHFRAYRYLSEAILDIIELVDEDEEDGGRGGWGG